MHIIEMRVRLYNVFIASSCLHQTGMLVFVICSTLDVLVMAINSLATCT